MFRVYMGFKVWEYHLSTNAVRRQYSQIFKVKIYSGTDNFQTTKRQFELHYHEHTTSILIWIINFFFTCLFVCFFEKKGTKKDKKYDFLDVYGGVSRDIFCLPREEDKEEEEDIKEEEDKEEALIARWLRVLTQYYRRRTPTGRRRRRDATTRRRLFAAA